MVRCELKGTEVDLGSFGKELVFSHSDLIKCQDRKKTWVSQVTVCAEPRDRAAAAGVLNLTAGATGGVRRSTIQPINHSGVSTCWEHEFRENTCQSLSLSFT